MWTLRWVVGTPGLASWETFSRPCGTGLAPNLYPALRAGLSSAVPSGLSFGNEVLTRAIGRIPSGKTYLRG